MDAISDFFHNLHNLEGLIQWGGFAILTIIVFAETGLLIGCFLPGDSLLFTAGALVGTGILKPPPGLPQDPVSAIIILNVLLMTAAITGDNLGYWFGRRTGPRLFGRPDSKIFKREHLLKTQAFYEKHGGKTLILARWIPFARTFAPIVAGIAGMPYRVYIVYSVTGGISWVASMTLLGYFLGQVSFVKQHNEKVILGIILLSVTPAIIHILKDRLHAKKERERAASAEIGQVGSLEAGK